MADFFEALRDRARDPVTGALRFIPPEGSDEECGDPAEWGIYATIEALREMMVIPPQSGKMYINIDDNPREIDTVTIVFRDEQ